mgnify:CR=1 FL=1
MPTEFRALADLCEKLEATKKRLQMTDLVADFLKKLNNDEVEPATSMILGRSFPKWDQRVLEVSWATLSDIIKRLANMDWEDFRDAFNQTGDVGGATKIVFEKAGKIQKQATLFEKLLTILEVRHSLEAIAETTGYGSREKKERLLETLLSSASPLEAKYLVKILIGEMRTGFYEGMMEQSVAKAFGIPLDIVQRASMLTGDIAEVVALVKAKGKDGVLNLKFQVFRPIKPMMAQMATNINEVLKEHGGETALEYKLDGARIQIHKSGSGVKIYSRRLTDVTDSLPEVVQLVDKQVKAHEAILEGEIIAISEDGTPMLFQHLMRRFRRVHEIEEMTKHVPVKLYLFDLLYFDDKSLIDKPYIERRRELAEIAGSIQLTEQIVTRDLHEAEDFLEEALGEGHEGLVAKKLDSPYAPGIRGKRWFKIKQTLEPLDLVIVAAEYGYGRRRGWLSDYYLAARDAETGELLRVGKTFKGLTDKEIVDMTRRLEELTVKEEYGKVVVLPKIVVEVAYNEIQKSPTYKCGMALRFARIIRVRDDKSPEEVDTIQRVREIYERQYEKKARFT